jgi:formylmethanofuran dehydrogenase subunit D
MEGIQLKVQVRAFPSQGRARIHESVLPDLEIKEGESLEILKYPAKYDDKSKPVSVAAYADTMVNKDVIKLSPEDMAALGVTEGDTVTVRRKVPLTEQIGKKAGEAGKAVSESAAHAGDVIAKKAGVAGETISKGASQAGVSIKKGAGETGEVIEKGAKDVAKKIKPEKGEKDL